MIKIVDDLRGFILYAAKVKRFFRRIDQKLWYFLIPVGLAAGSALFDGLSIGLLIPLLNGIIKQDFASVYNTPVIRNIAGIIPSAVTDSYRNMLVLLVGVIFFAALANHVLRYSSALTTSFFIRRSGPLAWGTKHRKLVFGTALSSAHFYSICAI